MNNDDKIPNSFMDYMEYLYGSRIKIKMIILKLFLKNYNLEI